MMLPFTFTAIHNRKISPHHFQQLPTALFHQLPPQHEDVKLAAIDIGMLLSIVLVILCKLQPCTFAKKSAFQSNFVVSCNLSIKPTHSMRKRIATAV